MNYINHYINKIICGDALEVLKEIPDESVNCCVCSPPFWGLRDYGIEPVIWDGDKNCRHIWGNKTITLKHKSGETNPGKESWFKDKGASDDKGNCFCIKCGAWKGSLGLEPTFDLYIKHLCDIFDEVKKVLRKDGTCWVNLGDSYAGSGKGIGTDRNKCKESYSDNDIKKSDWQNINVPAKSLCLIPQRFIIEMVNRGWIARNENIWNKPNCMPSSAKDRFTVDYEPVFFFSKSNKTLFWTNEKTLDCVDKKPLGIKGIEGKDWEWKEPNQSSQILTPKDFKTEWEYRKYIRAGKEYDSKEPYKSNAPGCKKIKRKKVSLWSGHDYWFEQQFEEQSSNTHFKGIRPKTTGRFKDKSIRANNKVSHKDWHEYTPLTELLQGRNKRCVWIIPTQPFPEAHFAVYPEGLIEIPIKAGCPEFICKKCGKARVKILRSKFTAHDGKINSKYDPKAKDGGAGRLALLRQAARERGEEYHQELESLGYSDCGCNAGFESGIVLDPFTGAGTSALVALKQRKKFIGIEIKQEYIKIAEKRISRVQQELI